MQNYSHVVITGAAGFIGSHVIRLFVNKYPNTHFYNLDKLTYAGNLANLTDIENKSNYTFIKAVCLYVSSRSFLLSDSLIIMILRPEERIVNTIEKIWQGGTTWRIMIR